MSFSLIDIQVLGRTYRWHFKVGVFLFCLFFAVLGYVLGVWQLHRYHQKKLILESYQQQAVAAPQDFVTVMQAQKAKDFMPVLVSGLYDNQMTMFVQNKMHDGQLGYEVLTPLKVVGTKKLLLVDRGWVKQPLEQSLPQIVPVEKQQNIAGVLKQLGEYQFILGQNILNAKMPIVMQKIDLDEIARVTGQAFYPFVLRLDQMQPNGFVRQWVATTVMPQRHMAYAVQWFLLAFIMIVTYFCLCLERKERVCDAKN